MGAGTPSASHRPQLDGLRAFAVLAVLVHHAGPPGLTAALEPGAWGVQLFFVLSGFLITGILLRGRAEVTGGRRSGMLRAFYIRRFLRIFPLYYAVLLAVALLNGPGVRGNLWWHLAYLSNYHFAWHGSWSGPTSHLWSLAVEEQFYLLWPWFVLFLPRRGLPVLLAAAVAAGPLARLVLWRQTGNELVATLPTPCCLDSLGLGGLLAWLWQEERDRRWLGRGALAAGVGLAVLLLGLPLGEGARLVLGRTAGALVFVWLVDRAATGFGGWAGRVLEFRPVVYLGTISYGLYVFQNFVLWLAFPHTAGLERFAKVFVVTLGLAAVSWYCYERPLNGLKRYFPYGKGEQEA